MMTWQDMDSAPRDGTEVLAIVGDCGAYEHMLVRWSGSIDGFPWRGNGTLHEAHRLLCWQPLPEAPSFTDYWENG